MKKANQLISAIMTLALGVLFLIFKAEVISVAVTVLGILLIVTAVLDFIRIKVVSGVIKAVLGILVLVLGWMLVDIAALVIGIVLLVYGILELIKRIVAKKKGKKLWVIILGFIEPVICIIGSIFLITSTAEAVTWAVIIAGVLLVINGILALIEALASKN